MRALGMDPVHDTQGCFRALVGAMSRPGTVTNAPVAPADHAVLATLVDHEVTCHTTDETIRTALANEGRFEPAAPAAADIVHAPAPADSYAAEMEQGTLKEPSDGATVVYRVDALTTGDATDAGTDATDADTTRCRLRGPGVPGERTLAIDGFPVEEAEALAAAQSSYPQGIDAILTTDDRIAAIPRSVDMEVR